MGRAVYEQNGDFGAGHYTIKIDEIRNITPGVYWYQIDTSSERKTGKFRIKIELTAVS
jgi:hypothetical protein